MATFKYRAINGSGDLVRGRIDAGNREDLEQRISRLGLELINADEAGSGFGAGLMQKKITRDELAQFCFYTERLVSGGVPLLEGLSDVRDSVTNPALRNVIGTIIQDIESGTSMSQALRRHPKIFDEVFVSLTEAGEQSGVGKSAQQHRRKYQVATMSFAKPKKPCAIKRWSIPCRLIANLHPK